MFCSEHLGCVLFLVAGLRQVMAVCLKTQLQTPAPKKSGRERFLLCGFLCYVGEMRPACKILFISKNVLHNLSLNFINANILKLIKYFIAFMLEANFID